MNQMHSYGHYAWECSMLDKPKRPTWIGYLLWFRWDILYWIKSLPCKFIGHDYKITGHANGDTGSDTATCSRCGLSHTHIYY